jgi:hypothetical protein
MTACPLGGGECDRGAPCGNPSWCAACRDADQCKARGERPQHSRDREIDTQWHAPAPSSRQRPTPQVTIEAIMYCVRERGLVALDEPENRERLARCDERALNQIDARIEELEAIKK